MSNLKIAAVQMSPTDDRKRNLDNALELMEKAVEQGAQIVGLPEDFSYVGDPEGKLSIASDPELVKPIPTLSEWGLLAMAGVLGVFGLLAIHRKALKA